MFHLNDQIKKPHGWITILLLFIMAFTVQAQSSFILSSAQNADSSESFFPEGATLYMKVTTTTLNVQQMKKMRWTIEKSHEGMMGDDWDMHSEFSGDFTNNMDSTFTASFDLSQLSYGGKWKWKAKLKDKLDHEVELESFFYYKDYSDQDSVYGYIEIEGSIQSIGEDSLVVNGYVFYVDSNTVVRADHDMSFSFSDLKVNDYVEVKAREQADGSYLAEWIKLEDSKGDHHDSEVEVKGNIEAVNDSSITVNGTVFIVNSQTVIKGHNHQNLTLADLSEGTFVEVKAQVQADGSYLALKIKVEERENYSLDVEIRGKIDSVGTDLLIVSAQQVFVTGQTEIKIHGHDQGSLADLQPGMKVDVEAYRANDGSLVAREIKVKNDNFPYERIEITGAVDSVGTDFIIVQGYTVYVDSNTIIVDAHYMPAALSDLVKGQIVKVKGTSQDNGSILADKIRVKELWNEFFKIEGKIEALGSDQLTVLGFTFQVDSNTVFIDEYGMFISFGDLTVGQLVKVKARVQPDGSYLALKVKLFDDQKSHIEVTGAIDSLLSDSILVNGIMFYVDSNTVVYDLQDSPIDFAQLFVGQIVEIKGVLQDDDSYYALRIKLEDDPNMVTMSSPLTGKTESSLIIGDTEYALTSSTVILNGNFEVIDLSDLNPGDNVTVWATPSGDGSYQTLQIQDETNGSITSTDGPGVTPVVQSFELKQNYPNPFNPATTIAFNLNGNGFAKVKLEVFNLLGQKVQTLFNGVLNSGSYRFKWTGRNEAGQAMASGIYFYKLTVNQSVQIKQMVLLK